MAAVVSSSGARPAPPAGSTSGAAGGGRLAPDGGARDAFPRRRCRAGPRCRGGAGRVAGAAGRRPALGSPSVLDARPGGPGEVRRRAMRAPRRCGSSSSRDGASPTSPSGPCRGQPADAILGRAGYRPGAGHRGFLVPRVPGPGAGGVTMSPPGERLGREEPWPAPGKLNLFLHVVGRRPDGYHRLQTAFQFIDLHDELRFWRRPPGVVERLSKLPGVPADDDLCVRAARRLSAGHPTAPGVAVEVLKRLPMQGGVGAAVPMPRPCWWRSTNCGAASAGGRTRRAGTGAGCGRAGLRPRDGGLGEGVGDD